MSVERDVYRNELLKLGHGLPIYEPDPAGQFDKVRVGDVGYVNKFGCFHRIFNAFLSKEHPINLQHGTPDDFLPLYDRSSATFCRTALPAGAMHSTHVRVLEGSFGVSGSCIPANAAIKFSVSNQQGAALVIKHPAFREDIFHENTLATYMLKHYRSWLTFIQDDLECLISLRDLVLVTGCDVTADWATATFVEMASQCEIEFRAGDPTSAASGSAAFWGTWQSSINVPHRCGPGPVRPPATPIANRAIDIALFRDTSLEEGPVYDQCIFLRGFRVRERKLRAPRIIKAAADPEDLDMDKDGDVAPVITCLECDSESDEHRSEIDLETCDQEISIYDTLLDFILEETDADVALISDRNVCRIAKYAEENLLEFLDAKSMREHGIFVTSYCDAVSHTKVGRICAEEVNAFSQDPECELASGDAIIDEVESIYSPMVHASESPTDHEPHFESDEYPFVHSTVCTSIPPTNHQPHFEVDAYSVVRSVRSTDDFLSPLSPLRKCCKSTVHHLEVFLGKTVERLGYGPHMTAERIRRRRAKVIHALQHAELCHCQESFMRGPRSPQVIKSKAKKIDKDLKRLLKYVNSKVQSTQKQALDNIIDLSVSDYDVRALLTRQENPGFSVRGEYITECLVGLI